MGPRVVGDEVEHAVGHEQHASGRHTVCLESMNHLLCMPDLRTKSPVAHRMGQQVVAERPVGGRGGRPPRALERTPLAVGAVSDALTPAPPFRSRM